MTACVASVLKQFLSFELLADNVCILNFRQPLSYGRNLCWSCRFSYHHRCHHRRHSSMLPQETVRLFANECLSQSYSFFSVGLQIIIISRVAVV